MSSKFIYLSTAYTVSIPKQPGTLSERENVSKACGDIRVVYFANMVFLQKSEILMFSRLLEASGNRACTMKA